MAEHPRGLKLASIMGSLFLALFCVSLDRTIIATAIPKITSQFNSLDHVGWYGSAYLLTSACFQLSFGKLYAEFNVKNIFLISLVIFEVGSVLCAAAPNSPVLIAGRAIAGLGTAGITTGALTILGLALPLHDRPKWTGIMGAAMGISQLVGPTIGGALADHVTWRWCFWLNLPIGGAAFPAVAFLLNLPQAPSDKRPTARALVQRFDLAGTALIVPSIVCLLLALQWGGSTYAWGSWRLVVLLVLFAVTIVAWCVVQVREGDAATLPLRILKQRSMLGAMLYMFCLMGLVFADTYYIPIWFQAVRNTTAQTSGINLLAMSAAQAVTALSAGFITTAIGYYVPLMLAGTVLSAAASGMITRFDLDTSTAYWAGSLVLLGFAIGFGGQQSLMVPQTIMRGRDIALGTSAMIFMQTISGTIFLSVAQNLFQQHLIRELHRRTPDVDPQIVIDSGASELQTAMATRFPADTVHAILAAYARALQQVFLLTAILACLSLFGSAIVEWKSVKKSKAEPQSDVTDDREKNTA